MAEVGLKPGSSSGDLRGSQRALMDADRDSLAIGGTFPCPGGSGGSYSDIAQGTKVVVRDSGNHAIGKAELAGGVLSADGCLFTFEVMVPKADSYRLVVAKRHGEVFSVADLEAAGWNIATRPH